MVCGQLSLDERKRELSWYFDDVVSDATWYVLARRRLRSRFCWRVALVAHAPHSMLQGRLNEADSAAGCEVVVSAVWLCECEDSTGSATMVMPSSSGPAASRPHIGSDFGGGTFFAGIPDSQCPAALPAQQAIVFAWFSEALARRNGSAATNRHRKHKMPRDRALRLMCFVVAITAKPTGPVLVVQAS